MADAPTPDSPAPSKPDLRQDCEKDWHWMPEDTVPAHARTRRCWCVPALGAPNPKNKTDSRVVIHRDPRWGIEETH